MAALMDGDAYMERQQFEAPDSCMAYGELTLADSAGRVVEQRKPTGRKGATIQIPLIRPNPPRLSVLTEALAEIERSGIFSNFGPINSKFEAQILELMFKATGACVTVANATLGLMLAIKQAVGCRPRRRYALMPSFTFAAAAQAAIWCGLKPLFCDIDRETWLPDAGAEEALLRRYGGDIAVLLPNATFGNCLDLARYDRLSIAHGIPLVVDAAASLGSLNMQGEAFGRGSAHPLVFSMHATKSFATSEGGLIYCADPSKIAVLRNMAGFGFSEARIATMPGLNAKLSEVAALLALTKLPDIEAISEHRFKLHQLYCSLLPGFTFQRMTGQRSALQFISVLLPEEHAGQVPRIAAELARHGIGTGCYFTPHLANHPFFQENCVAGGLQVTEELSRRMISLPVSDFLTTDDVRYVCKTLRQVCQPSRPRRGSAGLAAANTHHAGSLS